MNFLYLTTKFPMRRFVVVNSVSACFICTLICGCVEKRAAPSRMAKVKLEMEAYLQSCGRGYRVSDIEACLGLPEPTETEAPASDWPHWKFKYLVNDLVVTFLADEAPDGHEEFIYVGEPKVWLASDYWREIHHKAPLTD